MTETGIGDQTKPFDQPAVDMIFMTLTTADFLKSSRQKEDGRPTGPTPIKKNINLQNWEFP